MEENGTSVKEMTELLYGRLKKQFSEHPESRKIKNGIFSNISKDVDNILISDIESIRKLTDFFEDGDQFITNINMDRDEIGPENIKIRLIKS